MSIREEAPRYLVELMMDVIRAYDAAADKFIAKVENGQANSRRTYRELKECREMSNSLRLEIKEAKNAEKES